MTITWTKESRKGKWEWEKSCVERGLQSWKLKTLLKTKFANKVIIFEKTLEFKETIILCYGQ
jgi:hypothetical protein